MKKQKTMRCWKCGKKMKAVVGNCECDFGKAKPTALKTQDRMALQSGSVKWGHPVVWIAGSVILAVGVGRIICNVHEQFEVVKYREMFWGVVNVLCGAFLLCVDHVLTERRLKS